MIEYDVQLRQQQVGIGARVDRYMLVSLCRHGAPGVDNDHPAPALVNPDCGVAQFPFDVQGKEEYVGVRTDKYGEI